MPLKPADALMALEQWCRKYYRAEVHAGPFVMPGDEGYVKLTGRNGRTVVVDTWDCTGRDEDDQPTAGIGDMILEALRRWDADESPKTYKVMVSTKEPVVPTPAWAVQWTGPTYFQATVVARNDAEAIEKAVALFPPEAGASVRSRQAAWEV